MANRHPSFIARTILVRSGNVDEAVRLLNRVLGREGILDQYRRTRYYEKPFQKDKNRSATKDSTVRVGDIVRYGRVSVIRYNTDPENGTLSVESLAEIQQKCQKLVFIDHKPDPFPFLYLEQRRRINYEKCKAIYNEDMARKVKFISRKNREEPFPGCH